MTSILIAIALVFLLGLINAYIIQGFQQATLYDSAKEEEVWVVDYFDLIDHEKIYRKDRAMKKGDDAIKSLNIGDEVKLPTGPLKYTNKNILWWLRHYTQDWTEWITKPLYGCSTCMASFHSTYVVWPILWYLEISIGACIWVWLVYVLFLAGVSTHVAISMERFSPQ